MLEVASAVGLAEALIDENLVATAFAPSNDAFASFLSAYDITADQLIAQPDLASLVLSYHLVPGVAATASSLTNGQELPTQNEGETITVIKRQGDVLLDPTGQDAPNALVVRADIPAGKAIVHIINQVLIPANFPLSRGDGAAAAADETVEFILGEDDDYDYDYDEQLIEEPGAIERARAIVREGTELERPGDIIIGDGAK